MRAIVTGPAKGKRPAAPSFGSKVLRAKTDGSFNLTTANLVDLFRRGYQVDPARRTPRIVRNRPATVRKRNNEPTIPISLYRADVRR